MSLMKRYPSIRLVPLCALFAAAGLMTACATTPTPPGAAASATTPAPQTAVAPAPVAPNAPAAGTAPRPASAPATATAPGAAPGAPATAVAPTMPQPGQLPPHAVVIRDAKKTEALFDIWQREDRIWLELKPEDFDKPFFFAPKLTSGIGEGGFYNGRVFGRFGVYGKSYLVEFRRVHNQVRLVALNADYRATPGKPEARAVAAAFSPSLLASTSVASAPHPERKTVLIDATPLFMGDILGLGMQLQQTYRQGYSMDPRHTTIANTRGDKSQVVVEVNAHFATGNIIVPTPGAVPPGAPMPSTPRTLPDVRSMFVGIHYSFNALPEKPMTPRAADPRVGYFASTAFDFGDDLQRSPRTRVINRWRLEKKDPAAELSEPVKPITFWLDRTIPLKYRDAIIKGIEGWNPAFEKIGFKNAVVAKVQADDAKFDTLDVGYASVRWITNATPQFGAIGPSQVDPRTGEILDADISFESLNSRSIRAIRSSYLTRPTAAQWRSILQSNVDEHGHTISKAPHEHDELCTHGDLVAEQLGFAMAALEASGSLDPDDPEVEKFVQQALTDTTLHEVGHTLGLRHNFRSSKIYTERQLSDFEFTSKNGLAGSVMEYAPINLPRPGEKGGTPWQTTLGPYDFWAIEYGYKPIAVDQEAAELKRIAGRSGEPQLAYGTDEDNFFGIDPDSIQFDLGDDPVAFAKKRLEIVADILKKQESRNLKSNEDYSILGRTVGFALRDMGRSAGILARQIGGLRTLRDFPNTRRDPLQPVATSVQRQALDILASSVFSPQAIALSPALQRRLAPDFDERSDDLFTGTSGAFPSNYSVFPSLLDMQRQLLAHLMSDGVASRVIDNVNKTDRGSDAFRLSELYMRLSQEVWSEVQTAGKGDIAPLRRELQREFVNRLSSQLLRPSGASRADTRSLLRTQGQNLLSKIQAASKRSGLSEEARAHLSDSADTLQQALTAKLSRVGV